MSAVRSVLTAALVYAAANALIGLTAIVLMPVLTRVLSPDDYGRISIFLIFMQVTGVISSLSMHGAVGIRYFDQEKLDFSSYVATCVAVVIVSSVALSGLVLLFSAPLGRLLELPLSWLLLGVVSSGLGYVAQIQLAIWQASKKPAWYAALRLTHASLDMFLSLLFVIVLSLGWEGRAGGLALSAASIGAIGAGILVSSGYLQRPPRIDYAKDALRFGVPLVPHAIGGLLVVLVDRILIVSILGVGSAGIYMVAVQIGQIVLMLCDATSRSAYPWIIDALKANDAATDRRLVRFCYGYSACLTAGATLLSLIAPYILVLVVGEAFVGAAGLVSYIILGQAAGGIYLILSIIVFYGNRTGELAAVSLTAGVVNVALSYMLLLAWGVEGAAIGYLAGQLFLCIGCWWLATRARPLPWSSALVN